MLFRSSYFEANDASGSGGAACVNYTTDISNSDFFNNQANDGGAISSYGTATLGISESTFRSNRTDGLDLGGGGALFNFLGIVEIKGSLFQGNTALGEGGGAIENTGELVISNSQFLNNQAIQHDASQLPDTTSPGFGGAILLIDGAVTTLTDTTLTENTAATSGEIGRAHV